MGARALGPWRRMIEGESVSQRLVHDSHVPVLLVKPPVEPENEE
jgi:nucleotide-binding universal stress UspA family protein